MRISVLVENSGRPELTSEHGLSLFIETENNRRILFDMGQSDAFTANAVKMNIDLSSVDYAVVSHGHYDHSGGLRSVMSTEDKYPIYMSIHAFEPHWNGEGKYIGMDTSLLRDRIIFCDKGLVISENEELVEIENYKYPILAYGLGMGENEISPDDFRHEHYLLIKEKGKRILVSGCSHKGILNIMSELKPDVLIGGFHFMKLDPESPLLKEYARELLDYNCKYYTCHCTGQEQFATLKEIMGDRLEYISTGDIFQV